MVTPLQYLEATAERVPEKTAVEDGEVALTFTELLTLAKSIGTYLLREQRVPPRTGVAVLTDRSVYTIVSFLGVLYSGCYYVPVDSETPSVRIETMLSPVKPSAVLIPPGLENKLAKYTFKAPVVKTANAAVCEIDEDLLLHVREQTVDLDLAYAMFTSGSTGIPKAAAIRNRGVIDLAEWLADCFGFNGSEVVGNQTPFFFDASVKDIYLCLKTSATLVILPKKYFVSPAALIRFIGERGIDTILWATSAVRLVADSGIFDNVNAPQLKNVFFAGETMLGKHLNIWRRAMPNARFVNLYGPTEAAVDCTYYIVDREIENVESVPIGKPCANKNVFLVGDNGVINEPEITGEIYVRGSGVSPGYIGLPERTENAFIQLPGDYPVSETVYKTGDFAKYDYNGNLVFVSRADGQVKHMGARVELGEVEAAAVANGAVNTVCMYDSLRREIVLVYASETVQERDMTAALKKTLPRYMLPARIYKRDNLPQTANGKTDRSALKIKYIDKWEPNTGEDLWNA